MSAASFLTQAGRCWISKSIPWSGSRGAPNFRFQRQLSKWPGRSPGRLKQLGGFSVIAVTLIFGGSAAADERPPSDILSAIDEQLSRLDASATPNYQVQFNPGSRTTASCGMQHYTMELANPRKSSSFAVLLDAQKDASNAHPRQLFALTRILHVDADGSPRAYHPDDPLGNGSCTLKRLSTGAFVPENGPCALDPLANAGVRIFREKVRQTKFAFTAAWREVWPLIKGRRLKPLDLTPFEGLDFTKRYYGFYWNAKKMTVLLKKDIIIPAHDGFPCTRNIKSNYPGYFVAATTLSGAGDNLAGETLPSAAIAPAECLANRYIDAEQIPFFVIPGKGSGDVGVGDIVVIYANQPGREKIIIAVVGDSGPTASFGEGSIALNQLLLGQEGRPVVNNADANTLDISPARQLTVGILIFGGTKELLQGDYSLKNIQRVGRSQLSSWSVANVSPIDRLRACVKEAIPNPTP